MFESRIYRPAIIITLAKVFTVDFTMAEVEKGKTSVDLTKLKSEEEGWLVKGFVCCPWKKFDRPGLLHLAKWRFLTPNNSNIPEDEEELDRVLPIRDVKTEKLNHPPEDKIQVTWIGHATVLVQFDGISILSDPVFLDYCGPHKIASYKRYRRAAYNITDILKLDAVIISHNHFDHLEENSVKEIAERFPDVQWFVTLKQGSWLIKKGVNSERIHELDWWDEKVIRIKGKAAFTFVCTPTQHWCGRTLPFDMNKCLWCSWVIKGPTKSYYFAGDTGYYDKLFKAIGEKYGPFDLAAIPIGAYEPRYITEYQHVDPGEAVKIHQDVKSKQSIGMHWGTFALTNEFFVEPPQKIQEEMKRLDLDCYTFVSLCHGETWCLGDERQVPPFMTYRNPKESNREVREGY